MKGAAASGETVHGNRHHLGQALLEETRAALQVYKVSIGAACNLSWPADRLVIQVLDDSTEPAITVVLLLVNAALWFEWSKIQTPTDEVFVPYDSLAPTPEGERMHFSFAAICKDNKHPRSFGRKITQCSARERF
ncbi:uncharacterized protein LOC130946647 isoform X1 [Arachis stenosperma]|uniref:uncharacterized protein LOC130946647 isoform X1 n=1 Tax=Arachis stenosperma TaxID=217475 RepID=UPI0025AB9F91|nr:uncharacterized protein LOC130946647 isoform X1 [Arachis stenosperma]XP_057731453.1 uncharacterized protein LOC130946647 isoform X1 [Arachis stenosperma]XP_057731454.1 uncharacterized protein LOC130946647 isoform X1 [Arachis stenosperma]XP_057731455.1 uncharacterized protein LOC130946647 isoform X1 [Arachis stenosperma]